MSSPNLYKSANPSISHSIHTQPGFLHVHNSYCFLLRDYGSSQPFVQAVGQCLFILPFPGIEESVSELK